MNLDINGKPVEVPAGGTVLEAARRLGIPIPTLCWFGTCKPFSSCMVCVVKDTRRGRLIPSCVAPAEDGMVIETDGPEVRTARKTAIELLLSEHVGDCEAPCRRGCPVHMDAPLMIRQVKAGDLAAALRTARQSIALPRVIGRLCHAPCEKTCRRDQFDEGVAIRLLERLVADAGAAPHISAGGAVKGRVAIAGGGPAGLAAAYHLRLEGYGCTVFDSEDAPGGTLRRVSPDALPGSEFDADLAVLRRMGVEFRGGRAVGEDIAVDELKKGFAAIVLAVGKSGSEWISKMGLKPPGGGTHSVGAVLADGAGVFACGSAVRERKFVIQALADGQAAARWVAAYLEPQSGVRGGWGFDCHLGRLKDGEMAEFLKEADARARVVPRLPSGGFAAAAAVQEAGRCLYCDCRKAGNCRLRECAESYGAGQAAFRGHDRLGFERLVQHADVVYEPGKCIRCGLCVQITAQGGERYGFTFVGRGFDVRIATPFNEPLSAGLVKTAAACVEACPTGALAFKL